MDIIKCTGVNCILNLLCFRTSKKNTYNAYVSYEEECFDEDYEHFRINRNVVNPNLSREELIELAKSKKYKKIKDVKLHS